MVWGLECQTKWPGSSLVCSGTTSGLRGGEWPAKSSHIEMESQALSGVAQWMEGWQEVACSIPCQGTGLGFRLSPYLGECER